MKKSLFVLLVLLCCCGVSKTYAVGVDCPHLLNGVETLIGDTNTVVNLAVSCTAGDDIGKAALVSRTLLTPFGAPFNVMSLGRFSHDDGSISYDYSVVNAETWSGWSVTNLPATNVWSKTIKQEGTYVFRIKTMVGGSLRSTHEALLYIWGGDAIKLESSRKLADGRYEYTFSIDPSSATGDKSAPFWMAEDTGWGRITLVPDAKTGRWMYTFAAYNRQLKFAYGGFYNVADPNKSSWGATGYYSPADTSNVFELYNGVIFQKGTSPLTAPQ